MASEVFAYVAHKAGKFHGTIDPSMKWEEAEDWWQWAVEGKFTISTVFNREEYNALISQLGVKL